MDPIATAADYLAADVAAVERGWAARGPAEWEAAGLAHAVRVFRQAAARVPAYRDFLRRHGVDPAAVRDAGGFAAVPPTDKGGYVDRYPLADRMWDGDPGRAAVVHASSGTGGAPQYWPCDAAEVARSGVLYELILTRGLGVGAGPALLVVCFGMGTWVAGAYTAAAAHLVRQKGLPVTVVTPGFDKAEALAVLGRLGPLYERVVIAGIPSFVKDLLDDWRPGGGGRVGLFLAGEGFPEGWRDYVAGRAGGRPEDVVGVLGSADAGLIGWETPRTVALRRRAAGSAAVRDALFPGDGVPAVLSYVPTHRYYEAVGGRLLLTADRAVPLVRYDTQDRGGLLPAGAAPPAAGGWVADALPLVYVFGRGRLSATLYGANVLPEYAQEFLVSPAVAPLVTGRFELETVYTAAHDQRLRLRVELRDGAGPGCEAGWAAGFAALLRQRSSEYARIWREYGERALPEVAAGPAADPGRVTGSAPKKVS